MNHDRIHSREPSHHVDRWSVGIITAMGQRDGHCVVTVRQAEPAGDADETVDLVVTFAVRDLFAGRLPIDEGESPVGERVWYRQRGG